MGATCTTCGGNGIVNEEICIVCYGTGEMSPTGMFPNIIKKIIDLGTKYNDIVDKCNDIKEKCDDIWTKLNE